MTLSKKISNSLVDIVTNKFDSNVSGFYSWLLDMSDEDVGTGKDLLDQVNDDIYAEKHHINDVLNLADLELTKKTLQNNPNTWFVYSTGHSLAKPMSENDLFRLRKGVDLDQPFDLLTDENTARKSLKKLA